MPRFIPVYPGDQFNDLTVMATYQPPGYSHKCVCACRCGKVTVIWKHNLTSGNAVSCGCHRDTLLRLNRLSHGMASSRTYKSWASMKGRVRGDAGTHYLYKGVDMDPRWETFENFLADMGERPEGCTLDRIDNEKGYWPDNTRWATPREQSQNRRPWGAEA